MVFQEIIGGYFFDILESHCCAICLSTVLSFQQVVINTAKIEEYSFLSKGINKYFFVLCRLTAQLPTNFISMIENKKKQVEISNTLDINKSKEQLVLFKTAILAKSLELLEPLLHEKFKYFDGLNKQKTLEYFQKQFNKEIPEDLQRENAEEVLCMDCSPGSPVLYFHIGYWPVIEGSNIPKGIMFSFSDGLISDLTLCFKFCYPGNIKRFTKNN